MAPPPPPTGAATAALFALSRRGFVLCVALVGCMNLHCIGPTSARQPDTIPPGIDTPLRFEDQSPTSDVPNYQADEGLGLQAAATTTDPFAGLPPPPTLLPDVALSRESPFQSGSTTLSRLD